MKPSTFVKREGILVSLAKHSGALDASALVGAKLTTWMNEAHPKTNSTTRHDRYGVVQMAYNWAKKAGHVKTVPMAGMKRPKPKIREVYLDRSRWGELMKLCNPELQFFCEFLLVSGARPQEGRDLRCGDWIDGQFVMGVHRSKGEQRGRVILVPEAFGRKIEAAIEGRAAKDHAFLNTAGRPITRNGLVCAFKRIRNKLKIDGLVPYSLRHSYAVDRLRAGVAPEFVAQCMGHADTEMIYKRYGHLAKQTQQLKNATELDAFDFKG